MKRKSNNNNNNNERNITSGFSQNKFPKYHGQFGQQQQQQQQQFYQLYPTHFAQYSYNSSYPQSYNTLQYNQIHYPQRQQQQQVYNSYYGGIMQNNQFSTQSTYDFEKDAEEKGETEIYQSRQIVNNKSEINNGLHNDFEEVKCKPKTKKRKERDEMKPKKLKERTPQLSLSSLLSCYEIMNDKEKKKEQRIEKDEVIMKRNREIVTKVDCWEHLLTESSLTHLKNVYDHLMLQPEMKSIEENIQTFKSKKYQMDYLDEQNEIANNTAFSIFLVKFDGEKIKITVHHQMTIKQLKLRIERTMTKQIHEKELNRKKKYTHHHHHHDHGMGRDDRNDEQPRKINWKRIWSDYTLSVLPHDQKRPVIPEINNGSEMATLTGNDMKLKEYNLKCDDKISFTPRINKDVHSKPRRYRSKLKKDDRNK